MLGKGWRTNETHRSCITSPPHSTGLYLLLPRCEETTDRSKFECELGREGCLGFVGNVPLEGFVADFCCVLHM